MKWAILSQRVVTSIVDGAFPQEKSMETGVQVVDVTDQDCRVGWILQGNKIGPIDVKALVADRIKLYQDKAPQLLRDLYATNTPNVLS